LANIAANSATLSTTVTSFDYATRLLIAPSLLTGLIRPLQVITTFKPAETQSFGVLYDATTPAMWCGDLLYKNVHAFFGATVTASRVQKWIDDVEIIQTTYSSPNLKIWPGHGNSSFDTVAPTLGFSLYLKRFLALINSCVAINSIKPQMIHLFPRFNATSSILDFIATNPAWTVYQTVACDKTGATRSQLCEAIQGKIACDQARPLCIFKRAISNRPTEGTCEASNKRIRPSPPFGF